MRSLYIALALVLVVGAAAPALGDDPCVGAANGTLCPDDLDPCTVDVCVAGLCTHTPVPDRLTCNGVIDAYRRTLLLGLAVQDLGALLETVAMADPTRAIVGQTLAGIADDLGRASDALAGRLAIAPPGVGETIAQARARAALGLVRATPVRVQTVLRTLTDPGVRAVIGPTSFDLARRTRSLYRGTNQLKRELRRLQRVSGTFVSGSFPR